MKIQLADVRVIAHGQHDTRTLVFTLPAGESPRADTESRVPVDAVMSGNDGVDIEILLHVVDGYARELEIYRVDGAPITRPMKGIHLMGATDRESGGLILSADRVGLGGLMQQLETHGPTEIVIKPAPSRQVMDPVNRLDLRPGDGDLLLIAVEADAATVAGSHDNFRALAEELRLFAQENDLDEPGMHMHFDPSE